MHARAYPASGAGEADRRARIGHHRRRLSHDPESHPRDASPRPDGVALWDDPKPVLPAPPWRHLAADVPAVTAAVEGLADAFDLRAQSDRRWVVDLADPPVQGELSVQSEGARTRVGLAINTREAIVSSRALTVMSCVSVSVGVVMGVMLKPVGSFVLSAMHFIGPLLIAAATFIAALTVYGLRQLWHIWQVHRWARGYQHRLWLALDARLGFKRIYR